MCWIRGKAVNRMNKSSYGEKKVLKVNRNILFDWVLKQVLLPDFTSSVLESFRPKSFIPRHC